MMRYQTLYNLVQKWKDVTFELARYPDNIVIPTVGYAVMLPYGSGILPITEDQFDSIVGKAIADGNEWGTTHVTIRFTPDHFYVDHTYIFTDKQYAMGFSHGAGMDGILDLRKKKTIWRKKK